MSLCLVRLSKNEPFAAGRRKPPRLHCCCRKPTSTPKATRAGSPRGEPTPPAALCAAVLSLLPRSAALRGRGCHPALAPHSRGPGTSPCPHSPAGPTALPPLPSSPQPDPSPRGLPLTRPRRHPRHAARSEAAPRRRGRPIKRSSARGTAPPDPEGRAPPARPPRAPRRAATSGPGSRGPTGRSRDAVRAGRAVMEPRSPELRPPPQQRSRKVAVGA